MRVHADPSGPWSAAAPDGGKPLVIERFRPNVIVSGVDEAFGEDDWIEATVEGQGSFLFPNRCPRCMVGCGDNNVVWMRTHNTSVPKCRSHDRFTGMSAAAL